jgi:hypothetical protein
VVVRGSLQGGKFVDTKEVIRSRELKKVTQYNVPKKIKQRDIYTTLHRNKKIKQRDIYTTLHRNKTIKQRNTQYNTEKKRPDLFISM